jgi:hypothetical protein
MKMLLVFSILFSLQNIYAQQAKPLDLKCTDDSDHVGIRIKEADIYKSTKGDIVTVVLNGDLVKHIVRGEDSNDNNFVEGGRYIIETEDHSSQPLAYIELISLEGKFRFTNEDGEEDTYDIECKDLSKPKKSESEESESSGGE